MSNFFTRSKDDMKYLFKNKEELSKKERKRKKAWLGYTYWSYISSDTAYCIGITFI